jgi:hypothetical protein
MQGELQHEWRTAQAPGQRVHFDYRGQRNALVMKPRLGKTGGGFAEHIKANPPSAH